MKKGDGAAAQKGMDNEMKRYVIIGNGTSAVGCVEGIRSSDRDGLITIISAERRHVYCRPLISYYLEGKTDLERIKYRPDDFYEKNGCKVIYGRSAVSIDKDKKVVTLDDGERIEYDELCVAAGSSPFVPPIDGLDSVEKKFTFLTLDDALAIEKAASPDSRVLIVGAGLIGLKCAEGLHGRVKSITVCDLAGRVLSSILDDECASLMQRHLEKNGITFLLGDSAVKFDGNAAKMKSGRTLEFDVLVMAVGVRPNISAVKDAGGMCGRAITVDSHMRTSLPHIYAAGDCTESEDISSGAVKIMALMPNAYMQGECAGVNMAGGNRTMEQTIPMNSIGFFGLHAATAGSYYGEPEGGECFEDSDDSHIKRLFVKDGRLTGFIMIGNVERAGIYTSMIRNRTPIDSVDYEKLKNSPNLSAFDAEYRRKVLGGVV